MRQKQVIPRGIILPFILLSSLFFAWAVPNNLTDTMLAAFKRIMSLTDSNTARIQGIVYNQSGFIEFAYRVPAIAFLVIAYYGGIICRRSITTV